MTEERRPLDLLAEVAVMYRHLRTSADPMQMLATAADMVCRSMALDSCVPFAITPSGLATVGTAPLAAGDSERLRRRTLGERIPLDPGSREHELMRRTVGPADARVDALPSAVATAFGVEDVVIAPIAPDARPIAFLVASAPDGMDGEARALIDTYGHAIAAALDLVVMRMRAAEVLAETRRAATSIQALGREMVSGQVVLPLDSGFGLTFPTSTDDRAAGAAAWAGLLTAREIRIAELLVEGRSNRDIAEVVYLSPETVKTHVSNILKKLGVGNRAEAVARLLRVAESDRG